MLEASKAGMKAGNIKEPFHKDSFLLGLPSPTFIPPLEPFDNIEDLFLSGLRISGSKDDCGILVQLHE